jgi:hypothetical protein
VEDVAGKEDDFRGELDDAVDRGLEGPRDVGLALVDAAGRQALVLAEPEMQVGEMD